MPFDSGFHQARRDRLYDDDSFVVYLLNDEHDMRVIAGLKEWQANAIAKILNGERPRSWGRRKDERPVDFPS
jgi:hypothetical protein